MKILYVAPDQKVPGRTGGSVHVAAVAKGLAALGHEVHVLAAKGSEHFPADAAHWYDVPPPLRLRQLRFLNARRILRLARAIAPDVVIERYYNFGGEGLWAARLVGALGVLEVNAPVVDHPGSMKRRLDRTLLIEPLRRWRDWQCRTADLLVTPSAGILPNWVSRARVIETEWGVDTELFRPDAAASAPFLRRAGDTIALFAGAFRRWHGAIHLVEAVHRLRERGLRAISAVLVGDGPELPRVRAAAQRVEGVLTPGSVPHEQIPAWLTAADIGVAPFDVAAHPPLALTFYWSPLKVFEYMAAGLPVVTPAIDRLQQLVRHEQEGLLYDAGDPEGLATALERLVDPAVRRSLGRAARARAVAEFSWTAHCERLDRAIHAAARARLRLS